MISQLDKRKLRAAAALVPQSNIAQIIDCANTGIMPVEHLLMLLEVVRKVPTLLHDMDNNLGLTETPAFEGCSMVVNRLCKRKGVLRRFEPEGLMREFVGFNFKGMATLLQTQHGFDLSQAELDYYVRLEKRMVMRNFRCRGIVPTPGSRNFIIACQAVGFEQAIVSSSALDRINLSVLLLGLDEYFPRTMRFSAAEFGSSKPNALVYKKAAEILGRDPNRCAATEDSGAGVESASGANIGIILGYSGSVSEEEQELHSLKLLNRGAHIVVSDWSQMPETLLSRARLLNV